MSEHQGVGSGQGALGLKQGKLELARSDSTESQAEGRGERWRQPSAWLRALLRPLIGTLQPLNNGETETPKKKSKLPKGT